MAACQTISGHFRLQHCFQTASLASDVLSLTVQSMG